MSQNKAQSAAAVAESIVELSDVAPVEQPVQLQAFFLCPRFIPAQTLRKRLEGQKDLCKVTASDDPTSVLESVKNAEGVIIYHLPSSAAMQGLITFVSQISAPLTSGNVAIIVVSRTHVQQLKSFLSRFQKAVVFPTTVLLSDLEKQVLDILRSKSDSGIDLSQAADSDEIKLSRGTAAEKGTYVLKGKAAKSNMAAEDRTTTESHSAVQSQAEFKWGAKSNSNGESDESFPELHPASMPENDEQKNQQTSGALEINREPKAENQRNPRSERTPPGQRASNTAGGPTNSRLPIFQNKLFKSVDAIEERTLLLEDCIDSKASVTVAHLDCKTRVAAQFYGVDPGDHVLRCQLKGTPEALQAFIEQRDAGEHMIFSASLRQSRLFMASTQMMWVDKTPTLLELPIPDEMFMVQRRDNFRLVLFPDSSNLANARIGKTDGPTVEFPIYDVSKGGVGLLVPPDDARAFQRGDLIFNMNFQLEDVVVQCGRLAVRHLTPIQIGNEKPLVRVGLKFEKLNAAMLTSLGSFIEKNSMAYFTSYLIGQKK